MKEERRISGTFLNSAKAPVAKCMALTLGLSLLSALAAPPVYADPIPLAATAPASQIDVTGTVTDPEGEPLIGVNVRVEGTKTVATTDFDGHYKIKALKGQTLSFAYVGYQKATATVTSSVVDVQMQSQNSLDEVVVVGYGTVRKADLAGAVSVLEGKAF